MIYFKILKEFGEKKVGFWARAIFTTKRGYKYGRNIT